MQKQPFLATAACALALSTIRPVVCHNAGRWTVDYVRLQFAAARPG